MTNDLSTPWTLHFDRDGTEDFGIICDADGDDIVASHLPCTRIGDRTFYTGTFWYPEPEDSLPVRLRQLRLMKTAPKLLQACREALAAMEAALEAHDPLARTKRAWDVEPLRILRAAIAEVESD